MRAILLLLLLVSFPVLAAGVDKEKSSLVDIQAKVAAEKAKQDKLDSQVKDLEQNLKGLKTELIQATSKVQKNEKEMQQLETKLLGLTAQKKAITDKLQGNRKSLAGLVIAMERIRRVPPQAIIARPGAPLETAQAAVILNAIVPELNARAQVLKEDLQKLQDVENDLQKNKVDLDMTAAQLSGNKNKMETLLATRQETVEETKTQYKSQTETVAGLSRKASDLQDLIGKIEADNKKREAARRAELKAAAKKSKNSGKADKPPTGIASRHLAEPAALPSLGASRLPVQGPILVRYGQPDAIGAASEGIRIQGRKGSTVVAPIGGVVRYAGPFKAYGNIVLLEHKNNYHSLIAGLGRIDTVVGQSVDAGEPVGNLGTGSDNTPVLYYELRYNGKPINPARKLADLG